MLSWIILRKWYSAYWRGDSVPNLGIVVSDFNKQMTAKMLQSAQKAAIRLKANVMEVMHVPGSFEIPLGVKKLLKRKDIDAVVTLGVVKKGETDHDRVIAYTVAGKISGLSLEFEKPVALGIIGPNAPLHLAKARLKEYGKRAVVAAVRMLEVLGQES